jgi:ribonucleotide monophosphatase NagD (HAD superfamily)
MNRPKTLIIDIDGVLLKHQGTLSKTLINKPEELPGSVDTINKWESQGYNIILLSGRKHSMRKKTIEQLEKIGIVYDQLIMGIGGGIRILINDQKPDGTKTAYAISLPRDNGISKINIEDIK